MAPVGTAVQYVAEDGSVLAALVVADHSEDCKNLVVFPCEVSDGEVLRGLVVRAGVLKGDGPGCWHEIRPAVRRVVDGPVERFVEDGA